MPVTQRELTYDDLRKVIVALFETGSSLKDQSLTFSHGNIGNEYLNLSRYLDHLVADLEPRSVLVLLNAEQLAAKEASFEARIQMSAEPLRQLRQIFGAYNNDGLIDKATSLHSALKVVSEKNDQLRTLLEDSNQFIRKMTSDMKALEARVRSRKSHRKKVKDATHTS